MNKYSDATLERIAALEDERDKLLAALVKIIDANDTQLQHARTIEGATDRAASVLNAIAEAKKLIGGEA